MKRIPLRFERRPWGWFLVLLRLPRLWVKILRIRKGCRTSLQWHGWRSELWLPILGSGVMQIGHNFHPLGDGYQVVDWAVWHRLAGPLLLLEIAWGRPREGDVFRIADDYGRT